MNWSDICPVDFLVLATVDLCGSNGDPTEEEVDVVLEAKDW